MKRPLVFTLLLAMFFINCQPKKTVQNSHPSGGAPQESPAKPVDQAYLIGSWEIQDKYYAQAEKRISLYGSCPKKDLWNFTIKNNAVLLTIASAQNKSCDIYHTTKPIVAEFNGRSLQYFFGDVSYSSSFQMVNNNEFWLTQKDYINGGYTTIISVFKRLPSR